VCRTISRTSHSIKRIRCEKERPICSVTKEGENAWAQKAKTSTTDQTSNANQRQQCMTDMNHHKTCKENKYKEVGNAGVAPIQLTSPLRIKDQDEPTCKTGFLGYIACFMSEGTNVATSTSFMRPNCISNHQASGMGQSGQPPSTSCQTSLSNAA